MIVKAWNNGAHNPNGNGYGLKLNSSDRDLNFKREVKTILIELESDSIPAEVNIDKASFWNQTCKELISAKVGKWLIKNGLAPWPVGKPPLLELTQISGCQFRLSKRE